MPSTLQSPSEPSVTGVITGIVDDFQRLVKQQLDMVRAEVRTDWEKTKQAALPAAAGVGLLGLSGMLFSFMLVFVLHWLTAPPDVDPGALPLWACFGLIAAVLGTAGAALTYLGISRFQTFNPLPDESVRALQENMQWLSTRK